MSFERHLLRGLIVSPGNELYLNVISRVVSQIQITMTAVGLITPELRAPFSTYDVNAVCICFYFNYKRKKHICFAGVARQ